MHCNTGLKFTTIILYQHYSWVLTCSSRSTYIVRSASRIQPQVRHGSVLLNSAGRHIHLENISAEHCHLPINRNCGKCYSLTQMFSMAFLRTHGVHNFIIMTLRFNLSIYYDIFLQSAKIQKRTQTQTSLFRKPTHQALRIIEEWTYLIKPSTLNHSYWVYGFQLHLF